MSETVCRICRRESDHLESLCHSIREGLPLSVIVMIICPIKIATRDSFPKFICEDCLEIVLSAYKLRDESIESDRYFRMVNANPLIIEQQSDVVKTTGLKQENDDDPIPFQRSSPLTTAVEKDDETTKKSRTSSLLPLRLPPRKIQMEFRKNEVFPYSVDCFKRGRHKSNAWDYFGRLMNKEGEAVESEADFFFCKICVSEKRSIRHRYRSGNISTGMIFQHLKTKHGILVEKELVVQEVAFETVSDVKTSKKSITPSVAEPFTRPSIQGLSFSCTKKNCNKVYKMKVCLDIHLGIEHTGKAYEEPANTDYHVGTSVKDHSKSMAWSYFGPLLDSNYEVVDDERNYCRLCIGNGSSCSYVKTCSTTTLLHHLRDQHTQAKRKRKRFEAPEISTGIIKLI